MPAAPAQEVVRHLAIFHRFFSAWDEAATAGDLERLWLCQWVADALHNVPAMLVEQSSEYPWMTPERINAWVRAFPNSLDGPETPPRLIVECREMVAFSEPWRALDLTEGLTDLDLAPRPEFERAMRLVYSAFLAMRQRAPWRRMEASDWDRCQKLGSWGHPLARVLQPLPRGLVHWLNFDLAGFQTRLAEVWPSAAGVWNDPNPNPH
jgi:hypothetical protein